MYSEPNNIVSKEMLIYLQNVVKKYYEIVDTSFRTLDLAAQSCLETMQADTLSLSYAGQLKARTDRYIPVIRTLVGQLYNDLEININQLEIILTPNQGGRSL